MQSNLKTESVENFPVFCLCQTTRKVKTFTLLIKSSHKFSPNSTFQLLLELMGEEKGKEDSFYLRV